MNIELNKKQQLGLKLAVDRFNRGEKYTVIAGYAETARRFENCHSQIQCR